MALTPGSRLGVYDITAPLGEGGTPTAPRQLHLVVNWFEELKRLVPVR